MCFIDNKHNNSTLIGLLWCASTGVERSRTGIGTLDDRVAVDTFMVNNCWHLIYYGIKMYDLYNNK